MLKMLHEVTVTMIQKTLKAKNLAIFTLINQNIFNWKNLLKLLNIKVILLKITKIRTQQLILINLI